MKITSILLLLLAGCVATPALAQRHSYKSRAGKIAASAAAREKAERARRAEASAKAAAALPVTSGPDADELLRLEEAWAQATIRNNAEVISHVLADEYVAVDPQGLVTSKADVLAAIANDEARCDINKGFEFIVRVYGNAGVVIHNTSYRGLLNGLTTTGEYRVLHTFIKRGGSWQVVASQTTYVVPERISLVTKGSARERKWKRGKEAAAQ